MKIVVDSVTKFVFVDDTYCPHFVILVIKARRKAPSVVGDLCFGHVSDVLVKSQIISEQLRLQNKEMIKYFT